MATDPRQELPFLEYVPIETYTGARATPYLVGRQDVLQRVEAAINDAPTTHIIYVVGKGGIGKTRLLKHVLKAYKRSSHLRVASELIDLYHSRVHSLAGFIGAVLEVVEGLGDFVRKQIGEQIEELAQAELAGLPLPEVISQREDVGTAFIKAYNTFALQHRIVLALDTAERLFLHDDPVRKTLVEGHEYPSIWDWLLNQFLPNIRNTVILLAGRPEPYNLWGDLEKLGSSGPYPQRMDLLGLTEEEALEYFDAVIYAAKNSSDERDQRTANFLAKLSQDTRRSIFYSFCDDTTPNPTIRPIFLALAIDYVAVAPTWDNDLVPPLEQARTLSSKEREERRQDLGRRLVRAIQEDRHPGDELLRTLAWLPKGADKELLQAITGWSEKEIDDSLEKIRDLSFVKVRPNDNRYFLHDEMYALLREYGAERPKGIAKPLEEYYKNRIDNLRGKAERIHRFLLAELMTRSAATTGEEEKEHEEVRKAREQLREAMIEELKRVRSQLRDALVEDMYYRLRDDPERGYATFYRSIEEAISSADESLDMLLRAELFAFLKEREESSKQQEDDDLRAIIYADEAIRWVRRLLAEGEHQKAARLVEKLRNEQRDLIQRGGPLAHADLDVVEALVHTYLGDWDQATKLLREAGDTLAPYKEAFQPKNGNGGERGTSVQRLRYSVITGRLHNNRGYLHRVRGQIKGARNQYFRALPYWRHTKMEADHANTLTNMGYALALLGEFASARRHIEDALNMRLRLGLQGPIALTLNTWAQIEVLDGKFDSAEKYASQALTLAQQLGFERVEGLAHLTLASCYRFMSEVIEADHTDLLQVAFQPLPEVTQVTRTDRAELLNRALAHAAKAIEIFSERVKEPERLVEAYYLKGIIHRERFRYGVFEISKEDEKEKGIQSLEQAMALAEENSLWVSYLDALMGLAWLYYHGGDREEALQQIRKFEEVADARFGGYLISPGEGLPEVKDDTVLGVFAQMARKHALRAVMYMDEFRDNKKNLKALKDAAYQFAIGLEYDYLIADDFRDLRRAHNTIYRRIKGLNNREMRAFYEGTEEFENDYKLEERYHREKSHLREWLENTFGPYDVFKETAW